MKKILVVDNNDSFVYNLVEMLRMCNIAYDIVLTPQLKFPIDTTSIAGVILSPGAGVPHDYPKMMRLIREYYQILPMLGVCLGHQAIASAFNGELLQMEKPLHGHKSTLTFKKDTIFNGINCGTAIGRYHSWVINNRNLPACLISLAVDEHDNLMAFKHLSYPLYGLQFHPESIITADGLLMIKNWLRIAYSEQTIED